MMPGDPKGGRRRRRFSCPLGPRCHCLNGRGGRFVAKKEKKAKKSGILSHYTLTPPICQDEGGRISPQEGRTGARVFCGGLFEKSPPHPPKTPPKRIYVPMEGSANIVLPFSMLSRGVFVRRLCSADFGSCPSRSWTSSKPRPTECWRTVGVNISLPPRGRWQMRSI